MNRPTCVAALFLNTLLMAAPVHAVHAEETRYLGLCDASAAVALGETHFVVADDDRHVLTIYQRGKPEAVACVELLRNSGECLPRAKATKSDIEGAARIGNRIYWISSHARNQDGEVKAQRRQFFATDVLASAASPTVSAATPPYTRLVEDIAADPRFAVLSTASKQAIDPENAGRPEHRRPHRDPGRTTPDRLPQSAVRRQGAAAAAEESGGSDRPEGKAGLSAI
jgi:hypothetical protein